MCVDHSRPCPDDKPYLVTCIDCGQDYCSNMNSNFQCRGCYLYDEYEAGIL